MGGGGGGAKYKKIQARESYEKKITQRVAQRKVLEYGKNNIPAREMLTK